MKRKQELEFHSSEDDTAKLFWARVDTGAADACWNWTGKRTNDGFGRFFIEDKDWLVHRLAYSLVNHTTISKHTLIIQTCQNKLCCNPAHLKVHSWRSLFETKNIDGTLRGFAQYGEKNMQAALSEETVTEIRRLYVRGKFGVTRVAKQLGIPESTVGDVVRNKWWKWLKKKD